MDSNVLTATICLAEATYLALIQVTEFAAIVLNVEGIKKIIEKLSPKHFFVI